MTQFLKVKAWYSLIVVFFYSFPIHDNFFSIWRKNLMIYSLLDILKNHIQILKLNIKKYPQSQIQPNNGLGTHLPPASKRKDSSLLSFECDVLINVVSDRAENIL